MGKYKYYVITGFVPVYENKQGMRLTNGLFDEEGEEAAKQFYKSNKARLPNTKKLIEFDLDTSLYFLKYNIDNIVIMIRAKRYVDAIKVFESVKCLLAIAYHWYSEDADIVALSHKPSFTKTKIDNLAHLAQALDITMFSIDLHRGIQVTDKDILSIKEQLRKVFLKPDIRRALACFYQSQIIYYTHLVGSFVAVHSRPDLINASQEDFRKNNFRYQEMLHASLFTCYRGIEALYSRNFKTKDFEKANRKSLESYIDKKIPNAPSCSRYLLRFYRQREARAPKYKLLINMLEILLRARNRAAHGYRWKRKHRLETFGSDLVDESKFILGHLIGCALN